MKITHGIYAGRLRLLPAPRAPTPASCTVGNLSNPILIDDVYSLRKDRVGNVTKLNRPSVDDVTASGYPLKHRRFQSVDGV